MVYLSIHNPNAEPVTDLSVELKSIVCVLSSGEKKDVTFAYRESNRAFVDGDIADISAPILAGRTRLVYIAKAKFANCQLMNQWC